MIDQHIQTINGASSDYILAGMTITLSAWEMFFGFANPALAGIGMLLGVVLVIMRIHKQWKFRNQKDG